MSTSVVVAPKKVVSFKDPLVDPRQYDNQDEHGMELDLLHELDAEAPAPPQSTSDASPVSSSSAAGDDLSLSRTRQTRHRRPPIFFAPTPEQKRVQPHEVKRGKTSIVCPTSEFLVHGHVTMKSWVTFALHKLGRCSQRRLRDFIVANKYDGADAPRHFTALLRKAIDELEYVQGSASSRYLQPSFRRRLNRRRRRVFNQVKRDFRRKHKQGQTKKRSQSSQPMGVANRTQRAATAAVTRHHQEQRAECHFADAATAHSQLKEPKGSVSTPSKCPRAPSNTEGAWLR